MIKKKSAKETQCVRHELLSVCKLIEEAGVPSDAKWTSLILYMRSLKHNEALSPAQKIAVQELLVETLKARDFSDEKYRQVTCAQERIVAAPYLQMLQAAIDESAHLLRDFSVLLDKRRGDVDELGEFTVKTVSAGGPPDEAVRILRAAFHKVVQVMDEDARKLERSARTDELTGLANRRGFDEHLRLRAAEALDGGDSLGMLMLDIDHFKDVNDTYGHPVGDKVLQSIARHLSEEAASALDGKTYCARYGGEEFAVVLSGVGRDDAVALAERIRERLEHVAFELRKPGTKGKVVRVQCTVSIGVCLAERAWGEAMVQKLLDAADEALYEAKRSGRNRVMVSSGPGSERKPGT